MTHDVSIHIDRDHVQSNMENLLLTLKGSSVEHDNTSQYSQRRDTQWRPISFLTSQKPWREGNNQGFKSQKGQNSVQHTLASFKGKVPGVIWHFVVYIIFMTNFNSKNRVFCKVHDIIKIHNNVLQERQYFVEYFSHSIWT